MMVNEVGLVCNIRALSDSFIVNCSLFFCIYPTYVSLVSFDLNVCFSMDFRLFWDLLMKFKTSLV